MADGGNDAARTTPTREEIGPLPGFEFTSRFATIGGQRMHYVDEGPRDAPPIVMLHGNPTWCFLFRHLVTALRGSYRCIAPDHIGMGLSARPDDAHYPHRLERRIEDVEALLERLGLGEDLTLLLHDWGGIIGMGVAARRPTLIRRLVLCNTAAFRAPAAARTPWQIRLARSLLGWPLVIGLNAFCRGAARRCAVGGLPAAVRHGYLAPYDTRPRRRAVLRFVQDIPLGPRDRSYPVLGEIESGLAELATRPTLILWGMRDFVFTPAFLAAWVDRLPAAEVVRFDDGGHYLLEDHAVETVAQVTRFLSHTPPTSA